MSNHVPFFIVYGNVFEKDVSEHAKLIYLYLSSCVNRVTGACYPSYKTIGERCSIKSQTTISNALKELIAVGVLEVIHQSYKTKRSNNQYLLLEHPRNQKSKNEVSFAGPLKEKPAPSDVEASLKTDKPTPPNGELNKSKPSKKDRVIKRYNSIPKKTEEDAYLSMYTERIAFILQKISDHAQRYQDNTAYEPYVDLFLKTILYLKRQRNESIFLRGDSYAVGDLLRQAESLSVVEIIGILKRITRLRFEHVYQKTAYIRAVILDQLANGITSYQQEELYDMHGVFGSRLLIEDMPVRAYAC